MKARIVGSSVDGEWHLLPKHEIVSWFTAADFVEYRFHKSSGNLDIEDVTVEIKDTDGLHIFRVLGKRRMKFREAVGKGGK